MSEVHVMREEKMWEVLVVIERHRGIMEVVFCVVVLEYLGSFDNDIFYRLKHIFLKG